MSSIKTQVNQKGFTVVEVAMIVIMIAVIAFVGFYVYDSSKKPNVKLNVATKISAASSQPKSSATTTSNQTGQSLFKFSNLGVQFELPNSLSGFRYAPENFSDGVADFISTTAVENLMNQCFTSNDAQSKSNGPEALTFASISKTSGHYSSNEVLGEAQFLKQFSNFYVTISYPNGINPCYPNVRQENQLNGQITLAKNAFIGAFKSTATEIK